MCLWRELPFRLATQNPSESTLHTPFLPAYIYSTALADIGVVGVALALKKSFSVRSVHSETVFSLLRGSGVRGIAERVKGGCEE